MVTKLSPLDAYDLYVSQLEAEGYVAPATLRTYQVHIGRFLRDVDLPAVITDLSARHAIAWTKVLRARGLKPKSIASYQSSTWIWFGWLYRQGWVAQDISTLVRRVRVEENTITARSADETVVTALVACARDRSEHKERNAAIVRVLYATGARRSELAACQLGDYDREAGWLDLHNHTKGDRPRIVGVDAKARAALDRYIRLERGYAPGPLFMARQRRPMTSEAIRCMLRSLAQSAGMEASAHDFRRGCADRLNLAGVSPWTIQTQLGHATDSLTRKYARSSREQAALAEYHAADQGVRSIRRTG